MSTQQICQLAFGLSIIGMLTMLYLWLSAEREVNHYIRHYYQAPRVNKYRYKRGPLRRAALSIFGNTGL